MYNCLTCGDSFLFAPDSCPTCAASQVQKAKARRARERRGSYDLHHQISHAEFWQLLKWYPRCPCCGLPWAEIGGSVCQDHIIPISRGGIDHATNLQPLCQRCNLWKSDALICFDPHQPGMAVALPERLQDLFRGLAHFQPRGIPNQLDLFALPKDLRFPDATAAELERRTVELTWKGIRREGELRERIL